MSFSYGAMNIIGGTMSIIGGTMSNGKCVCVLSKKSQIMFTKLQGITIGSLDNRGKGT